MTFAKVQSLVNTPQTTYYPCTQAISVTAGNLIVVIATIETAWSSFVLASTGGETFSPASVALSWNINRHRIYAAVALASGSITISLQNEGGDAGYRQLQVMEFSGNDPSTFIDDAAGMIVGSYTGSLVTTVDNCLIVAFANSSFGSATQGGGFTLDDTYNVYFSSEHNLDAGVHGSKTVAFSNPGAIGVMAAAFRPSGGGGTSPSGGGVSPTGGGVSPSVSAGSTRFVGTGASWIRSIRRGE